MERARESPEIHTMMRAGFMIILSRFFSMVASMEAASVLGALTW